MWRACLDLQKMMDDLLIKRAELAGKRKKLAKSAERHLRERRRGTRSKTRARQRSGHSSDG
jgi:hypothetical protein